MKTSLKFLCLLLLASFGVKSQTPDSINVYYYENYPYSYSESGKLKGIEVDIIDEYIYWLKEKKNIVMNLNPKPFKEFSTFYNAVKGAGSKVIGIGSVTYNTEREKDIQFSAPYMQNLAVLITDGRVATVKTKSRDEVSKAFNGMTAMVVNNSSHLVYINDLKKSFAPDLKINTTETQSSVLSSIAADRKVFGFVDIVAYWSYLKMNPEKFLKIQKAFNTPKEMLGFIMPKNSVHAAYINEFFEAGFGFTSTKRYHQILEKYLGHEIIEAVEIK
ncbi:MAG: transporter substrate-binding domain-containing protein [Bacteroidia bacterium]|nr:transporter substrate-binding domain-containing protein [Bacteroidia bacterium]